MIHSTINQPIRDVTPLHDGQNWGALSLAFSPDDKTLAVGADDNTVRLWDLSSGRMVGRWDPASGQLPSMPAFLRYPLAFSADGKTLAVAQALWTPATGRTRRLGVDRNSGELLSLLLSADGKALAAGAQDGSVWLCDPSTGQPVRRRSRR